MAEVNADAERREAERNKGTRSKRKKKKRESGKKTEGGEEEKEKSRLSLDNPPPSSLSLSTLPPRSTLPTLQSSSPTSLPPPPPQILSTLDACTRGLALVRASLPIPFQSKEHSWSSANRCAEQNS